MDRVHDPIKVAERNTDGWLAARRGMVTASRAAAVCGFSPWETPRHVYEEMAGHVEPFKGNDRTAWGSALEGVILDQYERRMGCTLAREMALYRHPQVEFLGATPDAERPDPLMEVEAKAIGSRRALEFGEDGSDFIPEDVLFQVQAQMEVMGTREADVAAFFDVGDFRIFHVKYEPVIAGCILDAAKEMVERVKNNDPPEWDWTHSRTRDLVRAVYNTVDESAIAFLSADDELVWNDYRKVSAEITASEKIRDALHTRILAAVGNARIARLPSGGVELVRHTIAGQRIEYDRKPYVVLKHRKVKS